MHHVMGMQEDVETDWTGSTLELTWLTGIQAGTRWNG
jgi:hypothetical protein